MRKELLSNYPRRSNWPCRLSRWRGTEGSVTVRLIEILNHDLCKSKRGIQVLINSNEQIYKLVQFLKSAKGMHWGDDTAWYGQWLIFTCQYDEFKRDFMFMCKNNEF